MRISEWSSDVGSSDLKVDVAARLAEPGQVIKQDVVVGEMARVLRVAVAIQHTLGLLQKARRCIARPYDRLRRLADHRVAAIARAVIPHDLDTGLRLAERYAETRSEEHTSELQSLMRISYAVFCLKKQKLKINRVTYSVHNIQILSI